MYISFEAIQFNEISRLYELKSNYKHAIPEGLISDDKLTDAAQLSTVLGRALLLSKLKQNSVIIFYVEDRKIDNSQFKVFLEKYKNFKLIQISKTEYDEFKSQNKNIPEATYAYCDKEKQPIWRCIFSTQIINSHLFSSWKILNNHEAQNAIKHLNELLVRYNQKKIPLPSDGHGMCD